MRTTVGPLPAAVYWRRRAVVVSALLLGVIVLFFSCSGGEDPGGNKAATKSSQGPAQVPTSGSPAPDPSFEDAPPGAGTPSRPSPEEIQSGAAVPPAVAGGGEGTDTNVTVPTDGSCTDQEISVTPILAGTSARRGVPFEIRLKIKNVSTRTCSRDVGADLQELYIESGVAKVWSSDTCSNAKGSDVRDFPPNGEREYNVTWNGRQSNKCAAGLAAGTAPPAGQYQVRGRLGAKVSDPATVTLVD
ncbi:adhesin [Actinoplanes sp. NPDC051859]|uniref:adhesin n=1 Tax=Actinoplanes sp. NPDC051859 TaxID=3363909 RepID=UPI00378E546C